MMRKTLMLFVTGAIFNSAYAQSEDPNVLQFRQLYTKLAETIMVGTNEIKEEKQFLILASPGFILDPSAKPEADGNDRASLSAIVDAALDVDFIYSPKTQSMIQVYTNILNGKAYPIYKPDAATTNELRRIQREMSSDGWKQYLALRLAWVTAQEQVEIERRTGKPVSLVTLEKARLAREAFFNQGDGGRRDALVEKKRDLGNRDPLTWWNSLQVDFNSWTSSNSGVLTPVNIYSLPYSKWVDTSVSWPKYTLSESDIQKTTINSSTSYSGGTGFKYGVFSVGVSGSGSSDRTRTDQAITGLSMEFEAQRVNIVRPWMNLSLFGSNTWCMRKDSPFSNQIVSTGNILTSQTSGAMPLVITGLLLAKNLKMSIAVNETTQNIINSQSGGGGSLSFGPFRLGGRAANSKNEDIYSAKATGSGIEMPNPQIIGFFVKFLPKSPNPRQDIEYVNKSCKS